MDYKIQLKNISQSSEIVRLCDDAQSFVASKVIENFHNKNIIIITENDAEMENFAAQLRFFKADIEEKFEILQFPAWDCLPYDRASPKALISSLRIKCLYKIANQNLSGNSARKFLIITSVNSVLQKTLSPSELKNYGLKVKAKSKITIDEICNFLVISGYSRSSSANSAGEFAVRGGIVDFVTEKAADLIGYRIDFFGDEIESIKAFDPLSQITQESLKEIEILPASEVVLNDKTIANFRQKYRENFGASIDDQLYGAVSEGRSYHGMEHWLPFFYNENLVSFFDYFSSPVILLNQKIIASTKFRCELIEEYYQTRIDDKKINRNSQTSIYHPIKPEALYLSESAFIEKISQNIKISFNNFETTNLDQRIFDLEIKQTPDFALASKTNKQNPQTAFQLFKDFLSDKNKHKTIIACSSDVSRSQINRILHDYEIPSVAMDKFEQVFNLPKNYIGLINFPLEHGFTTSDLIFTSEQDLLGEKVIRKRSSNKAASQRILEEGLSINLGELVVHRDHGIGKFDGIHTISAANAKTDMVKILYGAGDTLFVPVDDINLITRYGADNPLIQLDRLGAGAWKNRKEKVRKKIKVAAEELLKIAAARHVKKAPIIIAEQHFYDEFKARFAFVETQDQIKAIEEVEEDLRKGSPMDRLICGDVGFGKTEVALRASAIVVSDESRHNKMQVAIIAPTTLLTRQHYKNFTKRFENSGIKIAQLSRLVGSAETKKVKAQLESGEINIVIGTHALLQKNIKFKNLALVIIDEEQHFGVAQKERLKELRNEVHILTLSATPIPRTLQMSLTGVKDLSLIATAPIDRLAVRNFVMPYDSVIVREAVIREYNRSGRVFFVVPRIRDIEEMEARLKILLPEIKITHAHGRMTPTELDKIMNDFVDGKIDLLLSTTIIESGIDIPEANTIIIYKSEMFGLSQLYQLRGRVGRSKVRAYAYFMLDHRKKVSADAQKKLEVMQNIDSLGVGFTIASHDMDIRGSGNILGDEQSGHIRETGVELYQQLLLETISGLKNQTIDENTAELDFSVTIKLGISLLIPESYMSDLSLRMNFYKRIANIHNEEEQNQMKLEIADRFGKIPSEILNLTEVAKLKWACKKVGIERLEATSDGIIINFKDNKFKNPDQLLAMVFSSKNKIKIHAQHRLLFICDTSNPENKISSAFTIINKLENLL